MWVRLHFLLSVVFLSKSHSNSTYAFESSFAFLQFFCAGNQFCNVWLDLNMPYRPTTPKAAQYLCSSGFVCMCATSRRVHMEDVPRLSIAPFAKGRPTNYYSVQHNFQFSKTSVRWGNTAVFTKEVCVLCRYVCTKTA